MSLGRVALFVSILSLLLAAFAVYLGWRLVPSSWTGAARAAAWGTLAAVILVMPASFLLRFSSVGHGPLGDALQWVAYIAMGLFLLALTFTIVRDLGWAGARITGLLPADPGRREAMLDLTSAAVLGVAAGAFGIGFARAVAKPTVVDVKVPIDNLPAALEGFTIAQISDIHIGPTIKREFLESVVAAVNGIKPDLVALTGDLVDGSVADLSSQTDVLQGLKATHGTYFITGNHEYYSGALEWLDEVRRLGLKTLVNEHEVVEHNGEKVVVAGVTDLTAGSIIKEHATDPKKAMAGAPADAPLKILLAHQPRSAYDVVKEGVHLQLSGHTHAGQFFPGTLLIRLVQPFYEGLNRLEKMWIYTNRGTGYWGPPLRHTSVTSEVTKLTLVRA
jgi:hypothetical protein